MNVAGRAVIVTGAASGLGLAFARRMACLGARVWALDGDEEALASASRLLRPPSVFVRCDVSDEQQVAQIVADIDRQADGISVLVNNAVVLRNQALVSKLRRRILRHSAADWNETLRCNLTSVFLMTREVAATMIERRAGGLIVNVASVWRHGLKGQSAYSASKAAIDALTVTWSQELAEYGIRVVGIAPGLVETTMTARMPPLFVQRLGEETLMGRFGTLAEFESTLQYVVQTDYLNGKTLELDGGRRF